MFSPSSLIRLGFLLSSLIPVSLAQSSSSTRTSGSSTTSSASSSSSSASTGPQIHKVAVGTGGFSYDPNTTYAKPGDIVVFEFFPTNHSVIRAEYTDAPSCPKGGCNPCVPYELIHPDRAGFHSPNVETQNVDVNQAITWNLTINDTQPIFYYCDALQSCHPNGMVGVINPNETVNLQKQYDAAVSAPYQLGPGQPFPAEGNNGGGMSGTSTPTSTPTATSTPVSSSGGHSGLSGGAIAGIVIGAVAVLLLAAGLFYFAGRTKTLTDHVLGKNSKPENPAASKSATSPNPDIGPWSPLQPMAQNEHRFSGMTAYSQHSPPQGGIAGYAEAPLDAEHKSPLSPPMYQGTFPNAHDSVELPGDAPVVSEAPTGIKE